MLPNIDIQFDNGNLGGFAPSPDGLMCLVANIPQTGHNMQQLTPYLVTRMSDVAALGIVPSVAMYTVHKALEEFYTEAGEGTPLWFFPIWQTMSEVFQPDNTGQYPIEKVLKAANGNIRGLLLHYNRSVYTPIDIEIEDGLCSDVWLALSAASSYAASYTSNEKNPFFVVIDGYAFNGNHTQLKDLTEMQHNRCAILLGDTEPRTGTVENLGTCIGLIGGRIAKNPVHVNIGKVLDGPVSSPTMYIVDTDPGVYNVAALHDKGFITFRKWVGKAGYYFTDDKLACEVSDDYHHLTNRRVIDKAYRIAYNTLLDTMLAEIPVNSNGTIQTPYAKTIENKVQSAIFNQMTAQGELSADATNPNDIGVRFIVDLTNNVVASSNVKGVLGVRPFGYNRYFDVLLGFDINAN